MIREGTPEDLPKLRALFAGANDAPYGLATVTREKCFDDGTTGAPSVRVADAGGKRQGAAITCGKFLRVLAGG